MDDGADGLDLVLEDTVRRWIRDHQRRQAIAVLAGLLLEISNINIAIRRGRDDNDAHACHRRAGGIGAVRGGRNQHDVAVRVSPVAVIRTNHHETRELTLCAGVRLQRDRAESRDLGESVFELADDLRVALRLVQRRERMDAREVLPRHRQHLARGVQLHRAGAQWNHRRIEPDVLPLEAADIPHHLRLGTMRIENRVCHERGRAA